MNRDEIAIVVVCRHLPGIGLCHRRRGIAPGCFSPETRSDPTTNRLQQCEAAVRLIDIMGIAKYPLALALSLVLIAGLLCSQICAFNCAFYGCCISSPVPASENTNEHAHCHQHKENTAPQKHNDSHQCAGHFDAVALVSSGTSAYRLHQIPSIDALIIQASLFFNTSPEGLVVQSGRKPDRSPPTHSVLRI